MEIIKLADFIVTINEPGVYTNGSFLSGNWPPQKKSLLSALKVYLNMAEAHKIIYQFTHSKIYKIKIGAAINMTAMHAPFPISTLGRELINHSFLNLTRGYHDFIGINYYNTFHFFTPNKRNGLYENPVGIKDVVLETKAKFPKIPIYITENGTLNEEEGKRSVFITSHLKKLSETITAGANVKGYFHWSLLDNFEWAAGYKMKFGFFSFDPKTFKRMPKKSAEVYAKICKENEIKP
jgi:beta-glucosidase